MSVGLGTKILTHCVVIVAMHSSSLSAFASEIDSVPDTSHVVATPPTESTPPTAPMERAHVVKTTDLDSTPPASSPAPTAAPTDADKVIILTERVNQLMNRVSELEAKLGQKNTHDAKVAAKLSPAISHETHLQPKLQTVRVSAPPANEAVLAPVNEDAVLTFRKGYALYQTAKYPEAILEWTRFQKDYPDHILAGSAQFYLGDSYFKQNEFKLAAAEFQKVLVSYDRSSHVSDALQRLTVCEEKNGNTMNSSKHRQMLKGLFAHSPAALSGMEASSGASTGAAITTAKAGHLDGVPGDKPMTAPMVAPNKPKELEPEEEDEPKEIND